MGQIRGIPNLLYRSKRIRTRSECVWRFAPIPTGGDWGEFADNNDRRRSGR